MKFSRQRKNNFKQSVSKVGKKMSSKSKKLLFNLLLNEKFLFSLFNSFSLIERFLLNNLS